MPAKGGGRPPPPPKPEELIEQLEKKFDLYKEEMATIVEAKSAEIKELQESLNAYRENVDTKIDEIHNSLENIEITNQANLENIKQSNESAHTTQNEETRRLIDESVVELKHHFEEKFSKITATMRSESSVNAGAQEQIQELAERVDEINEKMYEFEVNKKNNLIFYGIQSEPRETPSLLLSKVTNMLRTNLNIKRDISLSSASRVMTGPEVVGCRSLNMNVNIYSFDTSLGRPVVVTFQEFKDREEVLRKAGVLKGNNIHVTEDMSRRVRESRTELRKFMREVKKQNPAANILLQYDKLFVNHRCYVWSDIQGKVVEYTPGDMDPSMVRPGSVLARSSSVMSVSQSVSSPTKRRLPSNQQMWRSQSCMSVSDNELEDINQEMLAERDAKIRELEDTIKLLQEKLKSCEVAEVKKGEISNGDHTLEEIVEEHHADRDLEPEQVED